MYAIAHILKKSAVFVIFCFVFLTVINWQPENVIGSKQIFLLLRTLVEFQYATGKVKIHHFQHVIYHTCSIDKKISVEQISRP